MKIRKLCARVITFCCIFGILGSSYLASASASTLTAQKDDTVLVGFNDFGWCSFTYHIEYKEQYTLNSGSSTNTFDLRSEYFNVTSSRSNAPADVGMSPYIDHRNSSGINVCTHLVSPGTAILPGNSFAAGYFINTAVDTFAVKTTNTGHSGFYIAGDDSVWAYSTTLQINLGR